MDITLKRIIEELQTHHKKKNRLDRTPWNGQLCLW